MKTIKDIKLSQPGVDHWGIPETQWVPAGIALAEFRKSAIEDIHRIEFDKECITSPELYAARQIMIDYIKQKFNITDKDLDD